jgi:hypothetical protein
MIGRDPRVEVLLEKAWRGLVRTAPLELATKLATVDLLQEGRKVIRQALEEGLTDDEVIARVTKHLLQRNGSVP